MKRPWPSKENFAFPDSLKDEMKQKAAQRVPRIGGVSITEGDWVCQALQYEAQEGQFDRTTLRRMPRGWLFYLEGHQEEPADIRDQYQGHKLKANAIRARAEIDRRLQRRLATVGAAVAAAGVLVAIVIGLTQG